MKTWVKAILGLGAAATVTGIVAAITGKRNNDQDDEYVTVEDEANYDSDSENEAE